MKDTPYTFSYFLTWGILYGLALGLWSTTMIVPLFGTFYGLFWGPLVGAICGLISGIVAAVTQVFTFHADIDLGAYRRRASLGVGLLNAVLAPLILFITTRGTLWPTAIDTYTQAKSAQVFLVPCLLAAGFWGALSAAYTAHFYPVWLARLKTGQETELSQPSARWQVPNAIADLIRTGTNWLTIGLGIIIGSLIHVWNYDADRLLWWRVLEGAVLGAVVSLPVMVMFAIGNAALAIFIQQLFFSEDGFFSVSPSTQRRLMSAVAAVFTATICWLPLKSYPPSVLLIAPIMALAALYMYRAYPTFDQAYDKLKRKEKNADLKPKNLDEDSHGQALYNTDTITAASANAPHQTLTQPHNQKG